MKLPDSTRDVWLAHRDSVTSIGKDPAQPSTVILGGGTMLAARLRHRASIDIDLLLPSRKDVRDLWPGRRLDLERATGGRVRRKTEHRITATVPEGVLDITATTPELRGTETKIEVEGRFETVLTNAQILRGKLQRSDQGLPRDAFDLITAAKSDPAALEIAVNSLSADQRERCRKNLEKYNTKIAIEAGQELTGVPPEYRTPRETMGLAAAASIARHEYTRVQVYGVPDGITVLTMTEQGPRTTHWRETAAAALRNSGIGEYLDSNCTISSYEVEKAIEELADKGGHGLVVDTGDDDPGKRTRGIINRPIGADHSRERTHGKPDAVVRGQRGPVGGNTPAQGPPGDDHDKTQR